MSRKAACASCNRFKTIRARGLCLTCYHREYDAGTLDERWPRRRAPNRPIAEVIEDMKWLVSNHVPAELWAKHVDMSEAALERALYRAGERRLARQVSCVRRQARSDGSRRELVLK